MGGVLCILLFVLGTFLKGKLRVAADVGQSGALLEFRQFGFCGAQFVVDDADTFIDEVGAFLGHFILFGVGVLIIEYYQFLGEIGGSLYMGVLYTDGGNGTGIGYGGYGQTCPIACCCGSGGTDDSLQIDGLLRSRQ